MAQANSAALAAQLAQARERVTSIADAAGSGEAITVDTSVYGVTETELPWWRRALATVCCCCFDSGEKKVIALDEYGNERTPNGSSAGAGGLGAMFGLARGHQSGAGGDANADGNDSSASTSSRSKRVSRAVWAVVRTARHSLFQLVSLSGFNDFMLGVLCFNIIVMIMQYAGMGHTYARVLEIAHDCCSIAFMTECVFKILGIGFHQYFRNRWFQVRLTLK